jgi:hypothetical protein
MMKKENVPPDNIIGINREILSLKKCIDELRLYHDDLYKENQLLTARVKGLEHTLQVNGLSVYWRTVKSKRNK